MPISAGIASCCVDALLPHERNLAAHVQITYEEFSKGKPFGEITGGK